MSTHNVIFVSLTLMLGWIISACNQVPSASENTLHLNRQRFAQSVASGDPGRSEVVIWTRVSPRDSLEKVKLRWEVATDHDFSANYQTGEIMALPAHHHCVKVMVDRLRPGTTYYYRFIADNSTSPIGRTQTLPEVADTIRLAVVNCSKYEGGYFNGYDAVAKMDNLDAVVHLGDYIYENPSVFPASYQKAFEATGRKHLPEHEIISLSDYRTRFQQYREDTMLQHLHERYPMINIWDDHETANDSWRGGAQGHQPAAEGDWETRKAHALQAYFEWIPIRGEAQAPIYRSFTFGELVHLMMLDTRLCCRTQQAHSPAELEEISAHSSLIGDEQLAWITTEALNDSSLWNVFGNQVLFSRRYAGPQADYISYDQWTGYPKDRSNFLSLLKSHPEENFLLTTGNLHSAYHFLVKDGPDEKSGQVITQEFAPGSISSTNYDEKHTPSEIQQAQADLVRQNPHAPWFDLTNHGFIIMTFTQQAATISWYQVSTLYEPTYELHKAYEVVVHPHNHL